MTPQHLAEIHAACFTQPRPWSETEFIDLLASPNCTLTTTPNGFALIRRAGPEAELLTIAVHPSAQRRGEGRTLMTDFLATAKSQACEDIFLEVVATNSPAISLYKAFDFTERGYRKDYYNGPNGTKSSALVFYKHL